MHQQAIYGHGRPMTIMILKLLVLSATQTTPPLKTVTFGLNINF